MAIRTGMKANQGVMNDFDGLSKHDLEVTDDGNEEPLSERGWCGGDHTGEILQEPSDGKNLSDDIKFKDTMIAELQRLNQNLRMKNAEAETLIASMRVMIGAHCDCCARNKGTQDHGAKSRYDDSRSSIHSFVMGVPYKSSKDVLRTEDNSNPYIKVRNWQNLIPVDVPRDAESMCSSNFLKLSPPRYDNARPESPATSGLAGLVPLGESSASSRQRGFDNDDSRPISPQSLSMYRHDLHLVGCEDEKIHLPTVKSSPDERILSSRQFHQRSDSSSPSARIRSLRSPRESSNLETLALDQYRQATLQTMQYNWIQHENHPLLSIWNRPNDSGLVGRLMGSPNRK